MIGFFRRLLAKEARIKCLEETVESLSDALKQPHPIYRADTIMLETEEGFKMFEYKSTIPRVQRYKYDMRRGTYVIESEDI